MEYALQPEGVSGGRLFDADRGCSVFTQRLLDLAGEQPPQGSDEVIYVLSGRAVIEVTGSRHDVAAGTAVFVAHGTPWSATGDAHAVSVLVHDPLPAGSTHAVVDLAAVEQGAATAGRHFLLAATPAVGCASATQFVGLVPPGRAPDHFHTYDEVIYILEGAGVLHIGGDEESIRPGTCIHLPARVVHCLANTGEGELRLLGVFRPAGSPAEAYYPDGTLAVVG